MNKDHETTTGRSVTSETEARWRTLMVAAVALAYPAGQAGFEFGAYGEMSFGLQLTSWIAVTATMVIVALLPARLLPAPRWHVWLLAIPSAWMVGRFLLGITNSGALVHPIIFVIGSLSFIVSFPYAIYLIVRVTNPDLSNIQGLLYWSILAGIAVLFFASGFFFGNWNEFYVSCQEARLGRIETPPHCPSAD